jgi:hypothetical protein
MAVVVTFQDKSIGQVGMFYQVTGLVNGANTVTLPTPAAKGSFPPAADWTPTVILCFPYASGAVAAMVSPDYGTIVNTAGVIVFTLYAAGAANTILWVY